MPCGCSGKVTARLALLVPGRTACFGTPRIVSSEPRIARLGTKTDPPASAGGDIPPLPLSEGMEPLLLAEDAYAGKPNPHAWMSPQAAQIYVDRLVEAFSALDPQGAKEYEANGQAYKAQLQQLDAELRDSLQALPPGQRLLVTCEGAFSYLARDYGLEEAYLWPVNAESQISPRRMARLIDRVKRDQVPAVFCETTVSDKAQREVARAAGSRFGGSFYVDSLSDSNGPAATLLDLQRHNVKLIRAGLGLSLIHI